jgi:hypothetical protein
VFSALRVFALWNHNYIWSLLTLTLGVVPIMANIVCIFLPDFSARILKANFYITLTVLKHKNNYYIHHRLRKLEQRSPQYRYNVSLLRVSTWITVQFNWVIGVRAYKLNSSVTHVLNSTNFATVVGYLSRCSSMLSEIIVVAVTWAKTYRQWRDSQSINMPPSLSILLLRDGEIYNLCF